MRADHRPGLLGAAFWLALIWGAAGCRDGLSAKGAKAFLEKHADEFSRTATNGRLTMTATYVPPDVVALRNFSPGDAQGGSFEEFKKGYEHDRFFDFAICCNDRQGQKTMRELIKEQPEAEAINNYYNFRMGADLKLVVAGKDTADCTIFHRVETGGVDGCLLFSCAFRGIDWSEAGAAELLFHDRVFANETARFAFSPGELDAMPAIKK